MTPKPNLFIPLTEEKADALAAYDARPAEIMSQWSVHEIASASLIQNALSFSDQPQRLDKTEKALAQLISIGLQIDASQSPGEFARLMATRFNRDSFNAGLNDLPKIPARLLTDEQCQAGGTRLKVESGTTNSNLSWLKS